MYPTISKQMKNLPINPVQSCVKQTREMMMFKTKLSALTCCVALMTTHCAFAAETAKVGRAQAAPAKSTPKKADLPKPYLQKTDPQKQVAMIDSVVAVVNDDVITRRELVDQLRMAIRQLQKQGTPLPDPEVLE